VQKDSYFFQSFADREIDRSFSETEDSLNI
jgi:hypothetical protein